MCFCKVVAFSPFELSDVFTNSIVHFKVRDVSHSLEVEVVHVAKVSQPSAVSNP